MEHTNLVATELEDNGFAVNVTNKTPAIEVYLKNRKVNQTEVRQVLHSTFEGIHFNLQTTSNGVLVIV